VGTKAFAGVRVCANHSEVVAVTVCSVCGKPVCADCSTRLGQMTVCSDAAHANIAESWILIFDTGSEFEADIVCKNFELRKITTQVFSSRVYKQTIGEDGGDRVKVFVQNDEYDSAQAFLGTLGLDGVQQKTI
jgi:hypothetical protein